MDNMNSRTELLLGEKNIRQLSAKRVAVFGVGGVGGYAIEGLVRTGIGNIDIFDCDKVNVTNLNRQIIATVDTIGCDKVDAVYDRAKSINPKVNITKHNIFFTAENSNSVDFTQYDYIIDAIDTVASKLELIVCAQGANVPIISCMGTGNKLSPAMLEVADIYKTSVCPLARVMRYELKKRGAKGLKVVYSKEEPIKPIVQDEEFGRHVPASAVFVPACAGFLLASEVVKDLINNC